MKPVILLELNEINFDFVRAYGRRGLLPVLNDLVDRYGITETISESRHENIEPWIQWVTAHTGLSLSEHGVFRLGDIASRDLPQIWERLEAKGLLVGAVSPMNAKNCTRSAAFFLPDPWTNTPVTGDRLLERLHSSIAQAVNDNASARVSASSLLWLALGALRYARLENYTRYAANLADAVKKPWARACLLDRLLGDIFVGLVRTRQPHFSTLFLNSGAHVQHHYLFASAAYGGRLRNPEWYIAAGQDPLLDVLSLYDRIVADVRRAVPDARLMIATGLHQTPHEELTYYWRLRDHAEFLTAIGAPFETVAARMSRDFLVQCVSEGDAARTEAILTSVYSVADGVPVFAVDNRGRDLFVTLSYSQDITRGFEIRFGNQFTRSFQPDVVFVAVKNGEHSGVGYFLDTGAPPSAPFPLSELVDRIEAACVA